MNRKTTYIFVVMLSITLPIVFYFLILFILNTRTTQTTEAEYNPFGITEEIEKEPVKLLFIGDIMLDRTIRKDGERYGYSNLFSCLEATFSQYNSVIGNLEGTVTNFESVSRDAGYEEPASFRFTFDAAAVAALKAIGLDTVSIANNHIKDFGEEGVIQTVKNLGALEVDFFGNPLSKQERWLIKDVNGVRVAYIPYNEFFGTKEETFADLQSTIQSSDIQIIFAHWGDEYVPVREDIRELAYDFIESGADLIIGAHPHVIQEKEVYQGATIYYSLGNFIFDQYFQEDVTEGLAVGVEIFNNKIISFTEHKIKSKRHEGSCFVN